MGKLILLVVLATVLGGSMLSFRAKLNSNETGYERVDAQNDILARDASTSGHSLVLNAMIGTDGFLSTLSITEGDVPNGRFTVDEYTTSAARDTAYLTITGYAGGASHTITGKYEWDPIEFPGPVWLDVPYVSADIDPGARIDGGIDGLPVHFDNRRYDILDMSWLLPWSAMESNINTELANASGNGSVFHASNMMDEGYLSDLNVADASNLYYSTIGAMDGSDVTFSSPLVVSGATQNFGAQPKIVRISESLEIGSNGHVSGAGVLVVEGPITMSAASASLHWDGIILIHSSELAIPIDLSQGTVVINGALIVDHQAVPPGGHLDVTVNRDNDGIWSSAQGTIDQSVPWTDWPGDCPWWQHTHRFDHEVPEGSTLYFAEDGADRHETQLVFRDALDNLGSTPVYLEILRPEHHGYGTFTLQIAGQPSTYSGYLAAGFGLFSEEGNVYRTQAFRANDLETFIVDLRAINALARLWDTEWSPKPSCSGVVQDQWPFCVGNDWEREGAMSFRLRRESDDALFYEATTFWHLLEIEYPEYEEQLADFRDAIAAGEEFGVNLQLGASTEINYNLSNIRAIGHRIGFDQDEFLNRGSWTRHMSARDYRAAGAGAGAGGGPSGGGSTPPGEGETTTICHAGTSTLSLLAGSPELLQHLLHGDGVGACQ